MWCCACPALDPYQGSLKAGQLCDECPGAPAKPVGSLAGRGAFPCHESTAQRKLWPCVALLDAWWSMLSA